MYKLTKWYVVEIVQALALGGYIVSDSERFLAGESIPEPWIDTVDVDESGRNFIFYIMDSEDVYVCPFEDIRWSSDFLDLARFTKENLERLYISGAFADEAIESAHEKESSLTDRLSDELSNGDLYLEMGAGGIIDVHFKYLDDVQRVSCQEHTGMFKNSYLYCLPGIVDFRHFEFCCGSVDTYCISDSIRRLVVNNIGGLPVTIDHKVYGPGTTIACITEKNYSKGLRVPDEFAAESGNGAFWRNSCISSITIPNSVTEIEDRAFYECRNLSSITIPDSVTWIGRGAFGHCSSLREITIPDSVTWIGDGAFAGCSSLTGISMPKSLADLAEDAFGGCPGFGNIRFY